MWVCLNDVYMCVIGLLWVDELQLIFVCFELGIWFVKVLCGCWIVILNCFDDCIDIFCVLVLCGFVNVLSFDGLMFGDVECVDVCVCML